MIYVPSYSQRLPIVPAFCLVLPTPSFLKGFGSPLRLFFSYPSLPKQGPFSLNNQSIEVSQRCNFLSSQSHFLFSVSGGNLGVLGKLSSKDN